MRKERLTLEELQAMPKEAFPVTVECDDQEYTETLKKITILSPVLALGHLAIIDSGGAMGQFYCDSLCHYPSLKPEVKKVKWYRVTALRKDWKRPEEYKTLYRGEQDFLDALMDTKNDYHMIELGEVGEWEDFERVK